LKYRCKEKNKKLHKQLKTHHDKVVTNAWMKDLMHDLDSNKPESFNGFLTKFLPKHKFFVSTIINQGQTYLDVTSYCALFTVLWIKVTSTTTDHHLRLDRKRQLGQERKRTSKYKQKRDEQKNRKNSEGKAKFSKDKAKGLTYKTGMAGPDGSLDESNLEDSNWPKKKAKKSVCDTCGLVGHAARRASGCKYSTNVLSPYHGNLPPATDTKTRSTATVAAEPARDGDTIAD
jgi:hypothetical protein